MSGIRKSLTADRATFGSVLVALAGVSAAMTCLYVGGVGGWLVSSVGGSVVTIAAAVACLRVSRADHAADAVRRFWLLWGSSAALLLLSTLGAAAGIARHAAGMQIYEAVPAMLGVIVAMVAFRHVPFGQRTAIGWMVIVLDGAAVVVAGAILFAEIVVDLAPEGTPLFSRWAGGIVGVGCLLAMVVFGKAAVSPMNRVDPGALGILAGAPVSGLVAVMLYLGGSQTGMLLLSVVGYPLIALMICLAAWRQEVVLGRPSDFPTRSRPRRPITNSIHLLALAGTSVAVIIVAAQVPDLRSRVTMIGAVLFAAVVLARQLLGVRENREALDGIRHQRTELDRLASSDALTGLLNRTGFGIALTRRLAEKKPTSTLLIDIDNFKTVNDTLGPATADTLLRQIADRLHETCGTAETPARLGGDEFAVLLPLDDSAAAEAAADRIQGVIARPIAFGNQQLLLHASIGIAVAAPDDTADEVLRNADIAMYAAKDAGKACRVRFEPRMRHDMTNHARLAGELHDAVANGELRLFYQPIFDLETGRVHGAEALIRWQHPTRGFVSPGEFIPVAEQSGLIVPIGAWVLREACDQLARWTSRYGNAAIEAINVNVAVRQLREATFVDEVAAAMHATGLGPANLIVEVTESSVVDGWQVRETLQALHETGIRLALDDFGTGQSSLSLLRAFPVDVLKLDKSFVDGITDHADPGRLAVAAAVAQLTEHLQLKAVAEGIESQAQHNRLRDIGYRYGQGFFMAKPLPADDFEQLMPAADAAVLGS
ncbi:bifunctional diguanylate cyclase/phosphodiesterase [Actinoplanes sp. KI2]|uniref:putative bifunctional diguanylate cyclase/phosphodiesterase n=1 Tax=Actinoplanes sp. KI2 TaxID=2983315 RepID=UPI0021D58647|nr:bifunctional diguanylate cyclase/phosphodiesterase [Actinoplanes sp. KI2]MCU7723876.1 bifunctional diguanylate cyclase/phosphodiesterase [Actinoplanes sp. KI2]